MPNSIPPAHIVLTTTANPEEAARLGRTLVEERLAACATLIPAVQSIYRWQGEIESATETLLAAQDRPRATGRSGSPVARVSQLSNSRIPCSGSRSRQPALPQLAARESAPALTLSFPALIRRAKIGPSGILRLVFPMRWLLMVLLVSLLGLLVAALGVARHIALQRARSRSKPSVGAAKAPGQAEETDVETEI